MTKKAGAVSTETKAKLLEAARNEFHNNGFQNSSLRRICADAGVTTGALYFFFKNKEELFQSVLSEVTVPFMEFIKAHYETEQNYAGLYNEENKNKDFETGELLINYYYEHREVFEILLNNLSHPIVNAFMDEIIDATTVHYSELILKYKKKRNSKTPIDTFAVHWFSHLQVDTMVMLVTHGFTQEEVSEHTKSVIKMLQGAFMGMLND